MSKDLKDFILVNGVAAFLMLMIFAAGACGTGVGNPPNPNNEGTDAGGIPVAADQILDFETVLTEYTEDTSPSSGGVECGSFTESSPSGDVDQGRTCVRLSFALCVPARYLLNQTFESGARFVSYVSVRTDGACSLRVHTVSTDTSRFVGDETQSCATLSFDEQIELACGIGQ